MKNENNQSLYSHMLMFDPVNRAPVAMRPIPTSGQSAQPIRPRQDLPFEDIPGYRTLDDGSVEFTYYAPDAKSVSLKGIVGALLPGFELEKGENGYWRTVVKDLTPGFHYLNFYVDGIKTLHSTIPFGYGANEVMNYIEIADPDADFYLLKDVPHGTLHMEHIKSELTGRYRNAWIYTPPAYGEDPDKRYPVMYIQHGGGETEMGWFWQGKLNYIADNLIADGACKEMIIVCCAGYAYKRLDDGKFQNMDYSAVMIDEIVPWVDSHYRTIADREFRAIAGLSMGGGQARALAHTHPEVFANLGQFSCGGGFIVKGNSLYGATDYSELFQTPEHYNSIMKLTFVSCGTEDPRHVFTSVQVQELIDKGYNVEYHAYPGDHEWNPWRQSARDFMKELFR